MWRKLNGILGRENKSKVKFLKINGNIVTDESIMAQKINEFFIENVADTVKDRSKIKNSKSINFMSVPHSMMLEDANEKEIYDNISTIDEKDYPMNYVHL
jgi:hypothetical protein